MGLPVAEAAAHLGSQNEGWRQPSQISIDLTDAWISPIMARWHVLIHEPLHAPDRSTLLALHLLMSKHVCKLLAASVGRQLTRHRLSRFFASQLVPKKSHTSKTELGPRGSLWNSAKDGWLRSARSSFGETRTCALMSLMAQHSTSEPSVCISAHMGTANCDSRGHNISRTMLTWNVESTRCPNTDKSSQFIMSVSMLQQQQW